MNTTDLSPADPRACAMLAALDILKQAGIKATLDVRPETEYLFRVALTPLIPGATHLRDLTPGELVAILAARTTMLTAGLDAWPYITRSPFFIAVKLTAGVSDLATVLEATLTYQLHAAHADIAIIRAKAGTD